MLFAPFDRQDTIGLRHRTPAFLNPQTHSEARNPPEGLETTDTLFLPEPRLTASQAYLSKSGGEPDRIRKQGDSVYRAASSLDAEVSS